MGKSTRDGLERVGTVLIYLGVAVWAVYVVARYAMGMEVTGRQFLPYHLAGVVPGAILRRYRFFVRLGRRLFTRKD